MSHDQGRDTWAVGMVRKQYGLKFDEDLIERVDEAAKEAGVSRTEIMELAVLKLLSSKGLQEAVMVQAAKQARQGKRLAYTCEKCKEVRPRSFLKPGDPIPRCDTHGPMTVQKNAPYKGTPT
jgi:predicted transcriptional regulator